MSSLWILFLLAGAGLAIKTVVLPDRIFVDPIRGEEIKRIMSYPTLPDECKQSGQQLIHFAYVTMYNNLFKAGLYCQPDHPGRRFLQLQLLINAQPQHVTFALDKNSLLVLKAGVPKPVEDNEMFKFKSSADVSNFAKVSDDKMQRVAYNDLFKDVITRLLEDMDRLCVDLCKSEEFKRADNRVLYLEGQLRSIRMSVDCDKKTVRIVDEDNEPVKVFVTSGSEGLPITYDWKNHKYIGNITQLPGDRWIQIKYYENYTEVEQSPLYVDSPLEISISLDQLQGDLDDLWAILSSTGNQKGAVMLGDKMIVSLTKPSIRSSASPKEKNLIEVGGIFDVKKTQKIFYTTTGLCDNNNVQLPRSSVHVQKLAPQSEDILIGVQYIPVGIFRDVLGLLTDHIRELLEQKSEDQGGKYLLVDFVHKRHGRHTAWKAKYTYNGVDIYSKVNFRVLTAHTSVGDKISVQTKDYKLADFLPYFGVGAFITYGSPLRNVLAVGFNHYELNQDSRYTIIERIYNDDFPDWEAVIRVNDTVVEKKPRPGWK